VAKPRVGTTELEPFTRILLPDLMRRVAVLTILSALGIVLLAPLSARSALEPSSETVSLLNAADDATSTLDRTTLVGRERTLAVAIAPLVMDAGAPIGPESFGAPAAMPTPASAPMEATLYLKPTPAPTLPPVVAPPPTGETVTGSATWYCCSSGYRGMAVVALPGALGGQYDPPPASRYVTVCADRCVSLPVVDYCGCYWGTANQKVADLSPEAWAAVSDSSTSRGVIQVTIHLGG
jgi:hypothetical protein